jgi:hypothetical protein
VEEEGKGEAEEGAESAGLHRRGAENAKVRIGFLLVRIVQGCGNLIGCFELFRVGAFWRNAGSYRNVESDL